jgi:hypothetical protein
MRRKTTTPSAKWVASKAITILKKKNLIWDHGTCKSSFRTIISVSLDMTQFGVVCRGLLRTYMAAGKRVLGYSTIGKRR